MTPERLAELSQLVEASGDDWQEALATLTAAHEREAALREERDAIAAVLPTEFLDPPDGGDVTLAEQVRRCATTVTALREERDAAMAVLNPNMPESGLVDACKQVKQVAISEADNSEEACNQLEALREENARLTGELAETQREIDIRRREHSILTGTIETQRKTTERQTSALTAEREKVAALRALLVKASDEFDCRGEKGESHRCGKCDNSIDRNSPIRTAIAKLTAAESTPTLADAQALLHKANTEVREFMADELGLSATPSQGAKTVSAQPWNCDNNKVSIENAGYEPDTPPLLGDQAREDK